jgi:glucosamine-phosphate N-acetyltransferase
MTNDTLTHIAKIEPFRREHMEDVIDLLQHMSVFQPPKNDYDNIWATFSAQTHVFSIVAVVNSRVVAYGSIVIENKIRGGKLGHIEDIVISPNLQQKGIGKSLVNSLYEIAKKHGCYKVALQCQQHIVTFYEKCDYKEVGSAMQRFINH